MREDSILVLGGLALILFLSSTGSRTIAEIEGRVLSLDQIYEEWAPRNKQNNITLLMEDFLYKSQKLRALDGENLKSMTKKDLLDIITTMAKGPVAILEKLSHSVKTSHARDRELAEDFVNTGFETCSLLLSLFKDVYSLFKGESRETAKILTKQLDDQLQRVITFSF